MSDILLYAGTVAGAYLIGSLPVGLFVVRLVSGRDIRSVGSGRTGGTNAFRAAGAAAGILTGLGDMAKGFAAVWLAHQVSGGEPLLKALCATAAVAGHNWPIFLRFKGGAGTGPNAGAATALWPWTAAILIPIVPVIVFTTGYASVASTAASLIILGIFVIRTAVLGQPGEYIAYAAVTMILTAVALIPNYRRLIAGTEHRVSLSRRQEPQPPVG